MSLFQSNLRKQIRKLPKILKSDSVKIIHYCSLLFIRVLSSKQPDLDLGRRLIGGCGVHSPPSPTPKKELCGSRGKFVLFSARSTSANLVRKMRASHRKKPNEEQDITHIQHHPAHTRVEREEKGCHSSSCATRSEAGLVVKRRLGREEAQRPRLSTFFILV